MKALVGASFAHVWVAALRFQKIDPTGLADQLRVLGRFRGKCACHGYAPVVDTTPCGIQHHSELRESVLMVSSLMMPLWFAVRRLRLRFSH
jgi:hypothetical protein